MSQVSLILEIKVQPGKGEQLLDWYVDRFAELAAEPGTLVYAVNRSQQDEDSFWVYEVFADADAWEAHRGSAAAASFRARMEEIAVSLVPRQCLPVRSFGLVE